MTSNSFKELTCKPASTERVLNHIHIQSPTSIFPHCKKCNYTVNSLHNNIYSWETWNLLESSSLEFFNALKSEMLRPSSQVNPVKNQSKIRKYLIDHIFKIKRKFHFNNKIIHWAIYLIDQFLSEDVRLQTMKTEWISYGCWIWSIKFLYLQTELYNIKHLEKRFMNNMYYSTEELINIESFILKRLDYKLNFITPIDFIEYFDNKGIIFDDDLLSSRDDNSNSRNMMTISDILLPCAMYDILNKVVKYISYDYLATNPLLWACAIVCVVREKCGWLEKWSKTLTILYETEFSDFEKYYILVKECLTDSSQINYISAAKYINISNNSTSQQKQSFILNEMFKHKWKHKQHRNSSVSMNKLNSSWDEFIRNNIKTFNNKERLINKGSVNQRRFRRNSNNSNDSANNCKQETDCSTKATPEKMQTGDLNSSHKLSKANSITDILQKYKNHHTRKTNNNGTSWIIVESQRMNSFRHPDTNRRSSNTNKSVTKNRVLSISKR